MSHTPARIIAAALVTAGHAERPASAATWPITYDAAPDTPDNTLAVFNTVGANDGRLMATGKRIVHEGVQIRVRAGGLNMSAVAYAKAKALAAWCDTVHRLVVSSDGVSYTINAITRSGPVISLGMEEGRQRVLFSINALVSFKES